MCVRVWVGGCERGIAEQTSSLVAEANEANGGGLFIATTVDVPPGILNFLYSAISGRTVTMVGETTLIPVVSITHPWLNIDSAQQQSRPEFSDDYSWNLYFGNVIGIPNEPKYIRIFILLHFFAQLLNLFLYKILKHFFFIVNFTLAHTHTRTQ